MTYTEPAETVSAETTPTTEGLQEQQPTTEATTTESVTEAPQMFTVKVNGAEQQVTLDEALAGYQRQADYTQKTQALAEAERLWTALQRDPENTLRVLQDAYGIGVEAEDDEELDPEERRWREVEAFMQAQHEQAMQAQIDAQLAGLHQRFGDFDDNALIQHMVDHSIADFEAGYAHMQFQAQQLAQQQKQQADAQVQQQKAAAPPVAGGHGVQGGAVVAGAQGPAGSVAEAWAQAKQQLQM